MSYAYTIISVDDSREHRKAALRAKVQLPEITDIQFIDARIKKVAWAELDKRPWLKLHYGRLTWGELGVALSNLVVWEWMEHSDLKGLVVFEDDAIVSDDFNEGLQRYIDDAPVGWDAIVLFVPDNQRGDYYYNVEFLPNGDPKRVRRGNRRFHESVFYIGEGSLSRSYQGYSGVAIMWSPAGARKMLKTIRDTGMGLPLDCWIFQEANRGYLNVYAPHPRQEMIVQYDWKNSPTQIHDGRWFEPQRRRA